MYKRPIVAPSHCRYCTLSFVLVERSTECKHLCENCEPLFDNVYGGVPEYYYCTSCNKFCIVTVRDVLNNIGGYSYDSYPYCYGCDPDFSDDEL